MEIDQFIHASEPQHTLYVSLGADMQLPARLLDLARGHHDDANPCTIDMTDSAEVEDNLFLVFTHKLVRGPIQLMSVSSNSDSSSDLDNHYVGRHVPGLNLHHGRAPFIYRRGSPRTTLLHVIEALRIRLSPESTSVRLGLRLSRERRNPDTLRGL